jgi:hypothetical protein
LSSDETLKKGNPDVQEFQVSIANLTKSGVVFCFKLSLCLLLPHHAPKPEVNWHSVGGSLSALVILFSFAFQFLFSSFHVTQFSLILITSD